MGQLMAPNADQCMHKLTLAKHSLYLCTVVSDDNHCLDITTNPR